MIDNNRLDAYRRLVDDELDIDADVEEIAMQIERLEQARGFGSLAQKSDRQIVEVAMESHTKIDQGQQMEQDIELELSLQELSELELGPEDIDFAGLTQKQQVRYWSLLSPGEKLLLVRSHLRISREDMALQLEIPIKVVKHLEEDNFVLLPQGRQTHSLYRAYGEALGISAEQLIEQYEALSQSPAAKAFVEYEETEQFWTRKMLGVAMVALGAGLAVGLLLMIVS